MALAGAALPYLEDDLLSGPLATFLQRCSRDDIGLLDAAATRSVWEAPIQQSGAPCTMLLEDSQNLSREVRCSTRARSRMSSADAQPRIAASLAATRRRLTNA